MLFFNEELECKQTSRECSPVLVVLTSPVDYVFGIESASGTRKRNNFINDEERRSLIDALPRRLQERGQVRLSSKTLLNNVRQNAKPRVRDRIEISFMVYTNRRPVFL